MKREIVKSDIGISNERMKVCDMNDAERAEVIEKIKGNIENALWQAAEKMQEKDRNDAIWLLREDDWSDGEKKPLKGHMLRWAICRTAENWLPLRADRTDAQKALGEQELGRQLVETMNTALERYPGTVEMQKRMRELFFRWLSQAKQDWPVELDGLEEITLDSEDAKVVQLVRELHGPDGLGRKREDLLKPLNMSEKTLRNYLDRLSGKNEDHPLRLGGQIVSTPVAIRPDENDKREKYTYTPDTLNPIILQLNMTQVAYLLKSLCIASDTRFYGHEITEDLAYGVWSQLTPYAQKRVKDAFAGENRVTRFTSMESNEKEEAEAQSFLRFLARLASRDEQWLDRFYTEAKNIRRFDETIEPMFAFKSGCGLWNTYQIQCRDRVYTNCRFYYESRTDTSWIRVVKDSLFQRLGEERIVREHHGEKVRIADILKIRVD